MHTAFAIDWIRTTTKNHTVNELLQRFSYECQYEDWHGIKPKQGYSHALQHPYGHTIFWHIDRKDMGVNVMFSGRALVECIKANAEDPHEMVKWFSHEKFTFTRLDLAIDIHDQKIDILELFQKDYSGSINNEPELYVKGRNARGGATIYAGARKSEKFLRIYDKAKEQKKDGILWTRVEIELKGRTATKIAKQISHMEISDIAKLTRGMILGMYNPEDAIFQEALDATPVKVGSTKDIEHNTYEWLISSVSKTIARTIVELPHRNVWETLKAEVDKHIREMAAKSL